MDMIKKLLLTVHNSDIPEKLLTLTFKKGGMGSYGTVTNIDDSIMTQVIVPLFISDLDILSNEEMRIPVSACNVVYSDSTTTVLRIPSNNQYTGNRTVTQVLSIVPAGNNSYSGYGSTSNTYGYPSLPKYNTYSPLLTETNKLLDSLVPNPVDIITDIELIGMNTILVRAPNRSMIGMTLNVLVGNDASLLNINAKKVFLLGKMLVLRVKAHIYKTLKIEINKGYVEGGGELNSIAELVEEYKGAYEMYETLRDEEWVKSSYSNNPTRYKQLLRAAIPSTL